MSVFKPTPIATRPPSALSLWWLVPVPVRLQLQARPPLAATVIDDTAACVVQVGPAAPVRWLLLSAEDDGRIRCRLWEIRRTSVRDLAEAVVPSGDLVKLLQEWSKRL